jgi:hypothetical protein
MASGTLQRVDSHPIHGASAEIRAFLTLAARTQHRAAGAA